MIESGEPREVHHFACLAGYGAEAINPYLAFETLIAMKDELPPELTDDEIVYRYIKSIDKGLLKVMSKMGISTYQSYCGAQIFDAIGLNSAFVERDFFGTATTIEGVGMAEVAEETVRRHRDAFGDAPVYRTALDVGGEYAYRLRGEAHTWTPDTVATLQHAVRLNLPDRYRAFAKMVNEQENHLKTIRGLFRIKSAAELGRTAVEIDAVEPAVEIVKRFATGAMSYGSISKEAHETLAIAVNSFGGRSNSGEGGEERERFRPLPDGRSRRSAIKQVASGRFGVTTDYLVNADMMQIKVAQGAKPGEAASCPATRSTPRSPRSATRPGRRPDLAAAAPRHLLDRGSGPADLRPQERQPGGRCLGQAGGGGRRRHGGGRRRQGARRPHHHLGLRRRYGCGAAHLDQACRRPLGDRAGRDPADARAQPPARPGGAPGRWRHPHRPGRADRGLLGADQFGFSTAPLIAAGCIMMRKCHLNTCRSASRPRIRCCASASRAPLSTSSTTSSSSPRKCAS